MTEIFSFAALWLDLALLATLRSIWLHVATAMSETALGTDQSWIKFLSTGGATLLTFLAGAELDPAVMRKNWKEASPPSSPTQ